MKIKVIINLSLLLISIFYSCKKDGNETLSYNHLHVINEIGEFKITKDGGFSVFDTSSGVLKKYDGYGKQIWTNNLSFLATAHTDYRFWSYSNTNDNGFAILTSYRHEIYSARFLQLVITDNLGNITSANNIDTIFDLRYMYNSYVMQIENGNYLISTSYNDAVEHDQAYLHLVVSNSSVQNTTLLCHYPQNDLYYTNLKKSSAGSCYKMGFIGGGHSLIPGSTVGLTKLDSIGCPNWELELNFVSGNNVHTYFTDFIPTTDGGCLVSGYSNVNNPTYDFILQKIDSSGQFIWSREYGTQSHDYCFSFLATSDGGLLLVGSTSINPLKDNQTPDPSIDFNSKFFIVKLNENYDVMWQKTYGTNNGSGGLIANEDANGYVIVAQQNSHGNEGLTQKLFLRIDANGNY